MNNLSGCKSTLKKKKNSGFSGNAGTVITKETKEPNNRVLLGALLFGCIVSFVLRNLCLGTYGRNHELSVVLIKSAGEEAIVSSQCTIFPLKLRINGLLFFLMQPSSC